MNGSGDKDQVRANSNSPESKKLKRDNDVKEDLCDFTEALKKCETTDKMLEMAQSLFKVEARQKYKYRDEANDLREEKTSLEKDKNYWKTKFRKIKDPEVVRTEIESYDNYVPKNFEYNDDLVKKNPNIHRQNEEKRTQRLTSILNTSNKDSVIALRKNTFVYWLKNPSALSLGVSDKAKKESRKFKEIAKNFEKSEDYQNDTYSIFEYIIADSSVTGTDFQAAILEGPKAYSNFDWLSNVFERMAARMAEVHCRISENIHGAKFEAQDEIPSIYNVLTHNKYKSCIEILMSDITVKE